MSLSISLFDVAFWLMIALIAALAFAIESGAGSRHKSLVLSSILASTLSALMMLFLVEDKSTFEVEIAKPTTKTVIKKQSVKLDQPLEGGGLELDPSGGKPLGVEVIEGFSSANNSFRDCDMCPKLISLSHGKAEIGSRLTEKGRGIGESPRRTITISKGFAIGKYEVKRIEFAKFIKETGHQVTAQCTRKEAKGDPPNWKNPGYRQGLHDPVVCISYRDARAYILWLSEHTGRPYRLPSQAEWEYAARAGTNTAYAFGPTLSPGQANFGRNKGGTTRAGTYDPNAGLIHDMHGNVWEITDDCWTPDLSKIPEDASPVGITGDCTRKVIKGGAWDSSVEKLRSAARGVLPEDTGSNAVGFRVVRDMGSKTK